VPAVAERLIGGLAVREWGNPAEPGILLWPGMGATGAYFDSLAPVLPWRGVAVDPPGCGGSPPLDPCALGHLVGLARGVVDACGCRAVVGHSLGGYVATGLAANPPAGLRAAVLIDGGFLEAEDYVALGLPVTSGRSELVAWMEANQAHFPDWDTAFGALAAMIGSEVTAALRGYVRDVLVEVGGEVRERASPESMANLLLGVLDQDVGARARHVQIPTLLIACGEPADRRAIREQAWSRLAEVSSLIDLQVVEDWRHNPILQDPERATSMIVGWLERHI
jgi:pimeloyl-ACP methyl ester carboxylesterase